MLSYGHLNDLDMAFVACSILSERFAKKHGLFSLHIHKGRFVPSLSTRHCVQFPVQSRVI